MDWIGIIGYSASILLILGLIAGMFLIVRVLSGDSEQFKDLKEMVETLFNTPAHLRPGADPGPDTGSGEGEAAAGIESARPAFEEPCPACGETVNERHRFCPSCELRLQ